MSYDELEREEIGDGIALLWRRESRAVVGLEKKTAGDELEFTTLSPIAGQLAQHIIAQKLESEESMDAAARAFVKANVATDIEAREVVTQDVRLLACDILDVKLLASELRDIVPEVVMTAHVRAQDWS